jgi:hypothetical protein
LCFYIPHALYLYCKFFILKIFLSSFLTAFVCSNTSVFIIKIIIIIIIIITLIRVFTMYCTMSLRCVRVCVNDC